MSYNIRQGRQTTEFHFGSQAGFKAAALQKNELREISRGSRKFIGHTAVEGKFSHYIAAAEPINLKTDVDSLTASRRSPENINWKQKFVLWLGIVVFVGMTLYPPVFTQEMYETSSGTANYHQVTVYTWLFDISGQKINHDRLFMQWAVVLAVTFGGLSTLKDPTAVKRVRD